jgi:DNA gyrase/topoisomerase IV subunit A
MKTIGELNSEINGLIEKGGSYYKSDRARKRDENRIAFLKMCKRYLESTDEQSIRRQLNEINKLIATHEQRIADATVKMKEPAAKEFASDYGKRVGLPRLYEYQKSLEFIVDDAILSPQ